MGLTDLFKRQPKNALLAVESDKSFASTNEPTTDKDGVKRQLFRKDIIRTGTYKHPIRNWTLDVTTERMDKLVSAFNAMHENGVDVEVPVNHSLKAEDNKGYTKRIYREGDTLYADVELIGDGIDIANKNRNVSIYLEPDVKDGKGNKYGEAITHIAIVQKPIVPGQEDFKAIAASMADDDLPIYILSTEKEDKTMNELFEKIKTMADVAEVNEANALSVLTEYETKQNEAKAAVDAQVQSLSTITTERDELAGKVKALSAVDVDSDTLGDLSKYASKELSRLVETGKITPAVSKKLSAILIGEGDKLNAFSLSRKVSKTDDSIFNQVVDALAENDPVKLGEQTKQQVIALSRNVPDDDKAKPDEAVKADMIKRVSGK